MCQRIKFEFVCRDRRPRLSMNTYKICIVNLWSIVNRLHIFVQILHFVRTVEDACPYIQPPILRTNKASISPINKNLSVLFPFPKSFGTLLQKSKKEVERNFDRRPDFVNLSVAWCVPVLTARTYFSNRFHFLRVLHPKTPI